MPLKSPGLSLKRILPFQFHAFTVSMISETLGETIEGHFIHRFDSKFSWLFLFHAFTVSWDLRSFSVNHQGYFIHSPYELCANAKWLVALPSFVVIHNVALSRLVLIRNGWLPLRALCSIGLVGCIYKLSAQLVWLVALTIFMLVRIGWLPSRFHEEYGSVDSGSSEAFAIWCDFVQSISPGGSWRNISKRQEDDIEAAKPMMVLLALHWIVVRLWGSIGTLSLLVLCLTSGICSPYELCAHAKWLVALPSFVVIHNVAFSRLVLIRNGWLPLRALCSIGLVDCIYKLSAQLVLLVALTIFRLIRIGWLPSRHEEYGSVDSGSSEAFAIWCDFVLSVSPGGSWWNISKRQEDDIETVKPMMALLALRWIVVRLWGSIGTLSLLVLCLTSGICSPYELCVHMELIKNGWLPLRDLCSIGMVGYFYELCAHTKWLVALPCFVVIQNDWFLDEFCAEMEWLVAHTSFEHIQNVLCSNGMVVCPYELCAYTKWLVALMSLVFIKNVAILEYGSVNSGSSKAFAKWCDFVQFVSPDGSWWNLSEHQEDDIEAAKPMTVLLALRWMWVLVSGERWIIFMALGCLVIAALSEISMPSILAASIFSAQSGEAMGFYRNAQSLLVLCLTAGICSIRWSKKLFMIEVAVPAPEGISIAKGQNKKGLPIKFSHFNFSGLRSGCFGILNVILVAFLLPCLLNDAQANIDMTGLFNLFDGSTILQDSGHVSPSDASCINLQEISYFDREQVGHLTSRLSADCQRLSYVIANYLYLILVHNTFQGAGAGAVVNLLTLSTLVICSILSCRYLHFAILLGGMSVLSCCVTVEQLTKYVLYFEWLIYATLRVTNSLSSLLQSIGASEKVFQMMDLLPSEQFLSKGKSEDTEVKGDIFISVDHRLCLTFEQKPILEQLNFCVEANEVIAIVGLSGSGKSRLLNLLLRLYEPSNGQICSDGLPLKELDIRWLRQNVGYIIAQEPHLFHMDINDVKHKIWLHYGHQTGRY
ncbi:ABC transporter B family member 26, chloroplastic-like isoform X2 [Senna tora]|uniref:ABC transporter B family member 26, chloroplastic-like isoform X2 n=1 Tax=Senna tora TaxID=362788 RepID=A0A834WCG8_9FABA|nr:ABC transporter B family member 26, chloroplastic-like isoform X2 [Senna tora]